MVAFDELTLFPMEPVVQLVPMKVLMAVFLRVCAINWRELNEREHGKIVGMVSMLRLSGVEPDEITHVAFLEAYRRITRYQPGTDFFAWLCAFARNLALTECEKIQRRARNQHVGGPVGQQRRVGCDADTSHRLLTEVVAAVPGLALARQPS